MIMWAFVSRETGDIIWELEGDYPGAEYVRYPPKDKVVAT